MPMGLSMGFRGDRLARVSLSALKRNSATTTTMEAVTTQHMVGDQLFIVD